METEIKTKTSLKLTFIPTHETSKGIVIGELQTEGGWTICSIEKTNAEEIIKRYNMHDALVEKLKQMTTYASVSIDPHKCLPVVNDEIIESRELIQQAEQL